MKIAVRTFDVRIDGCDDTVIAGRTRCVADHELVRRFPDAWRDEDLADELAVRSARVAELNRDASEQQTRRHTVSDATRRERQEEAFWRAVEPLCTPVPPAEDRALDAICTEGLELLEAIDQRRIADETDGWRAAWQGRLG
jgi:hypothetical protein